MGRNVWLVVFQPQRKFLSLSASAAGREALPAMDHGSPTKEEICAITGQPTTPSEPEKDFQKKWKFQSAWTTTKLLICKNHNKCDLNRRLIRGNGSYYNTATGEKKIKSNYLHVLLSCSTRLRASKTWKGHDQIITNFKGENERGCTAANTSQQHSPPRTEGGEASGAAGQVSGTSASHVKQDDSCGLRVKASFGQLYSLVRSRCSINII